MSRWNDRVQAALFNPNQLAQTYAETDVTTPFPFNASYEEPLAPVVDGESYRLALSGLIDDKRPWTLVDLRSLPQTTEITRHVCIEGWSAIGKWGGVPFQTFLQRIGADLTAKYLGFQCADKYWTSIDMPSALHPQTLLVLDFPGKPCETKYGYPVKVRMPTKLGFKNPKFVNRGIRDERRPKRRLGKAGLQLVQRLVANYAKDTAPHYRRNVSLNHP